MSYSVFQLLDIIEAIGEENTVELLSDFSCPLNSEIELFLQNNAIEFARKKMSMTHLVFDDNGNFMGYFTLTHKPINIRRDILSNTMSKKIAKHAKFDPIIQAYSASAFLIAQFGKNYAIDTEKRISGSELMELTLDILKRTQHQIGGELVFLECEDREKLLNFYQNETNKFRKFGERFSDSETDNGTKYFQLMRFI